MHMLMLTPALPYPPHQGGALRNFGLIQGLHYAGHTITLLSFVDDPATADAGPLHDLCVEVVMVPVPQRRKQDRLRDLLTSSQPDLVRRLFSPAYEQALIALLQRRSFDLVQFEGLEMAGYLPIVRQFQPHARTCYDAHNAEYQLQRVIFEVDRRVPRRWPAAVYSWIQANRITQAEKAVCHQVDCVLAVSGEDAAALRSFGTQITVVPNGIFTQAYTRETEQLDLGLHSLVFTGKMDYRPNVDAMLWFAAEVLPLVRAAVPTVHLYIVGQKPHTQLERLRAQDHITITGWVPEVTPYLKAATVYIAPLRMGSGTRLKLLEAMATACAAVATSLAAAGLPEDAGDALVLADDAPTMAAAITRLLQHPDQRQSLGNTARQAVQAHYDWSVIIPRLLAAYKDIGLG
jgi:polysaccharide biosynthesis protein PslH